MPEPSTLALVALAGLALGLAFLKRRESDEAFVVPFAASRWPAGALVGSSAQADSTNDRAYLFGDNTGISAQNENATAGQKIGNGAGGVTFDTVSVANNPTS